MPRPHVFVEMQTERRREFWGSLVLLTFWWTPLVAGKLAGVVGVVALLAFYAAAIWLIALLADAGPPATRERSAEPPG